jgi:hypothetical protein
MTKCASCTAPLTGIEGHPDLFTNRMSGSRVQFKCRACSFLWVRSYAGEGKFEWAVSPSEFIGSEVPRGQH